MDEEVVDVKRWTELPGIRAYYDFFKQHEGEFLSDIKAEVDSTNPLKRYFAEGAWLVN